MKKNLRVGFLIDNDYIPAWTYKMIETILSFEFVDVVLVIKNDSSSRLKQSILKKLWVNRSKLLWILYSRLENILFKPQPNAFELKDINQLLKTDRLIINGKEGDSSNYFLQNDLDRIQTYDLDVLVNLCSASLKGDILKLPKAGIWSYCHGDRSVNRGGPPGVWEVFEGRETSAVILEVLSDKVDSGKILAKTYSSTDHVSINRNKNNFYWKALSLVPRKLNDLYNLGESNFFNQVNHQNNCVEFYDGKIIGTPSNKRVLKAFYKLFLSKISGEIKRLFYFNQWIILYKFNVNEDWSTDFHTFVKMLPPKDRFWADPFVMERGGKYFLFLEELVYKEGLGKISVSEIKPDGSYTVPKTIIQKDYHMSYPFIFEDNGALYMIPETSGGNQIQLYECTDFPYQWEIKKILMEDICAVDSTILKHDGKYWLFCNIKEHKGASSLDELFIYFSDSIEGEWIYHPCNPVISDVRQSRPAGRIFEKDGKLYRPSQDSGRHYGHGMKINEITELSTTTYKECTVRDIYPNWDDKIISTHTLNKANRITVIDGMLITSKLF